MVVLLVVVCILVSFIPFHYNLYTLLPDRHVCFRLPLLEQHSFYMGFALYNLNKHDFIFLNNKDWLWVLCNYVLYLCIVGIHSIIIFIVSKTYLQYLILTTHTQNRVLLKWSGLMKLVVTIGCQVLQIVE